MSVPLMDGFVERQKFFLTTRNGLERFVRGSQVGKVFQCLHETLLLPHVQNNPDAFALFDCYATGLHFLLLLAFYSRPFNMSLAHVLAVQKLGQVSVFSEP